MSHRVASLLNIVNTAAQMACTRRLRPFPYYMSTIHDAEGS